MGTDFEAVDHGSIVMLAAITEAAHDWENDNLPEDRLIFGAATAIEPRYFGGIVEGIIGDGLTVTLDGREIVAR